MLARTLLVVDIGMDRIFVNTLIECLHCGEMQMLLGQVSGIMNTVTYFVDHSQSAGVLLLGHYLDRIIQSSLKAICSPIMTGILLMLVQPPSHLLKHFLQIHPLSVTTAGRLAILVIGAGLLVVGLKERCPNAVFRKMVFKKMVEQPVKALVDWWQHISLLWIK
jgi:hypothetical protein